MTTKRRQAKKGAMIALPALKKGERYSGIALNAKGKPTEHVILLHGEMESGTHADALAFAKQMGGDLPTRQEQSLLFANAKGEFQSAWYWSSEQHASGPSFAWMQGFSSGFQLCNHKEPHYRARAVRRVKI